jgi:C4-dicarboxylate-specific signal transduction histidine kinase
MDTIRKVRGFAGKREHEPSPHHLRPLLEEAATLALIGRVGGGVALGLDLPDELPPVLVDRVQIGQVFVNLLRNAAEAMAGCPRREIAVTARPAHGGDMVEIAVADTGPGLPDSVRARLFMPFTTSKPDGLGIGLSTSRAIVQSHCGEMWAEDAPGGGAVFRLTLPVASGEAHG